MSVKAVGITCIAAAISYGLGMIGGAVATSGSIGYLLAMIVASILVVRTASQSYSHAGCTVDGRAKRRN